MSNPWATPVRPQTRKPVAPPRTPEPVAPPPRAPDPVTPPAAPVPQQHQPLFTPARRPPPAPPQPARATPGGAPPAPSAIGHGPAAAPVVPEEKRAAERSPRGAGLLIGVALALALAATLGLFYLQTRPATTPDSAAAAAQAATALRDRDTASLEVSFFDQAGVDVTGDLTVTKDGFAIGTLTDAGGGKADYHASGDTIAVRGDSAWWSRRDPARTGIVTDLWVRPDEPPFPVDDSKLAPAALAGMLDWMGDGGTPVTDAETVAGTSVVGLRRNGWTAMVSSAEPHRLVWFGGPMQDGTPLGTPLGLESRPLVTPSYVSVLVNPTPENARQPRTPQESVPIGKVPAKRPAFDTTVRATTCRTVTCTWSVTVRNTGTAAGDASVIASVAPGMTQTQVKNLGSIAPGKSATTPAMSFPNPAPTNKNVTADYQAQVFNRELHGSTLGLMRRLQENGIVPGRSKVLGALGPAPTETVLFALDAMRRARGFDAAKAIAAMEDVVTAGALPEVGELVRSTRLTNPEILYTKLPDLIFEYDTGTPATPVNEQIGHRRELQIAAGMLREDPAAKLTIGSDSGLVVRSGPRTSTVQLRSVSGDAVSANLESALKDLEKATGTRTVLLYVDPSAGYTYVAARDHFDSYVKPVWCSGNGNRADEVVVTNQTGTQRWAKKDFPGCA
ncbi:hypothetical protein [Actinoplanes palleronii]|nr:hypothetical protein [Actinoplanes palleronii]